MRILLSILLILILVPGWSGDPRLPLWGPAPHVTSQRVQLAAGDPSRRRIGALEYLGGIALHSDDPGFGGYSAMTVSGDRFTLLSDGGLILRFAMGGDFRPRDFTFAALPMGPGTGWSKLDRDSESMTVDRASGRVWVGFERANAIGRFFPGLVRGERLVRPPAMRRWMANSGAESLVRLRSGQFLAMSEEQASRVLLFRGDPVEGAVPIRARYVAPPWHRPADAAELPDGRVLVLDRKFTIGDWFGNRLTVIDPRAIRPGATIPGRTIAALARPLIHDNFEALAITREGGDTIVWLASDDNQSWFQRTLLLKFRLDDDARNATGPHSPGRGGPAKNRE